MNPLVTLRPMTEADPRQMQSILNDKRTRRHMPLANEHYSLEWIEAWLQAKSRLWPDPAMGPWAVFLSEELVGWAGVQPHEPHAHDLALVLAPAHWGLGQTVLGEVLTRWNAVGIPGDLVAFLPKTRGSDALATRLGWQMIAEVEIDGSLFVALQISP